MLELVGQVGQTISKAKVLPAVAAKSPTVALL